jgi:hypothetical protein
MQDANLALRFALELVGIVAAGYWGYHAVSGDCTTHRPRYRCAAAPHRDLDPGRCSGGR